MKPLPVLGLACHLPDADTPEAFWANLSKGHDSIRPATAAEWGADPATVLATPGGSTLDRATSAEMAAPQALTFNPEGFCLPAEELTGLPRDFIWPLHVARLALQDAGLRADEPNPEVGLILGHYAWAITGSTAAHIRPLHDRAVRRGLHAADPSLVLPEAPATGPGGPWTACLSEAIVTTLSGALGLGGPCYAIDAACASFHYALKLAAHHIRSGAARRMIVLAANASDQLFLAYGLSAVQALTRSGRSRPFDADSDGLTPGMGAVAMVVGAPVESPRRPPHGVIRSIGLSSDGRGQHLTAPNPKGQMLACRRALEEGGIEPGSVEFVECHATGTKVGDRTELEVLDEIYGAGGRPPPVGAVKSNLGHLMTAAGGVGLLKTLLAMRHDEIPPTVAIATKLPDVLGLPHEVPTAPMPWPKRATDTAPRRAAVNAFGFGGTNAHLVVDSHATGADADEPAVPAAPLAITGMASRLGPWENAGRLAEAMRHGRSGFGPLPPRRWRGQDGDGALLRDLGLAEGRAPEGAYIERLRLDPVHLRMPPKDVSHLNPQQLLMLDLGDAALRDAGIAPGSRVAVIVAMAIEQDVHLLGGRWSLEPRLREMLAGVASPDDAVKVVAAVKDAVRQPPEASDFLAYVGNLMASRISVLWDFSGPSFTLSSGPNGVVQAIDIARNFLSAGEADAVLVGAVDLAGGLENVAIRQAVSPGVSSAGSGFGFDAASSGWRLGEGAGAVVLRRLSDAVDGEAPIYATIDGLSLRQNGEGRDAVATAAKDALADAGAPAASIGYLEASGRGHDGLDLAEMSGLADAYSAAPPRSIALGSVAAAAGDCGVASGMAGLIRAALTVAHKALTPVPGWSGPRKDADWQDAPFHVPVEREPLLGATPRAAVSITQRGVAGHLVLGAAPRPLPRTNPTATAMPFVLPVGADTEAGLENELRQLARDLRGELSAADAERRAMSRGTAQRFVGCLVGDTAAALAEEAERMAARVAPVLASEGTWRSPRGSCITGAPVGPDGLVAFVYSGMQNAYPGLGRDALALLPSLAGELAARFQDPAAAMGLDLLFPRTLAPPSAREREAAFERLEKATADLLRIGVVSSWLQTRLVTEIVGLKPDLSFGYSLGEISMLFAAGAWTLGDDWLERLQLMHPLLERLEAGSSEAEISQFLVAADPAAVKAAASETAGLEVPLANSTRECVLRGTAADCEALLDRLGADHVRLASGLALHGRTAEAERDALAEAFTAPLDAAPHRFLFSAGAPDAWMPHSLGACIADGLARPLDFPEQIERAYAAGVRLFVELGPGGACTRWIDDCLGPRPHAAMSTARRGTDEPAALAQLLALLVAHRRPVDLERALSRPMPEHRKGAFSVAVDLGGAPISDTIADRVRSILAPPAPEASPHPTTLEVTPAQTASRAPGPSALTGSDPALPVARKEPRAAGAASALEIIVSAQSQGHLAWLRERRALIERIAGPAPAAPSPARISPDPREIVFGEADILEVAEGRLSNVFGPDFAPVDGYARRVRVPGQPFTAMSRVTHISGRRGHFDSGRIVTEYDIPRPAWYAVDGRATSQLALDAQGVLFLLSWLGVDLENQGRRRFRWLDARITMLGDLPREGDTLRYDINLRRAFRDEDSLMLVFDMSATANGRAVLRNDECCVGFFTDRALASGDGIRPHHRVRRERSPAPFTPPRPAPAAPILANDLLALSKGDLAVLSPAHADGRNPALRLPPAALHMVDRIVELDPGGGLCGLGRILAERVLDPDHWAIRAHFKDDCVFPGPCMLEGAVQILKTYALAVGLHTSVSGARFEPLLNRPYQLRFREQVIPRGQVFTYQVDIVDIALGPEPWLIADVEFQEAGRAIGRVEGLGLRLASDTASRGAGSRA